VPTDSDGMRVWEIERLMHAPHKMIYSIPTFQNPQGVTMSLERRRQLVDILHRHNLIFLEDDPYSALRFAGEDVPTVLQIEAESRGATELDGSVLYCGTFSKILTPGLRVGWVAAAAPVIEKLTQAKQAMDLQASTFTQFITYEMIRDEAFLQAHIASLRATYRERRDLMLQLMREQFPEGVTWTEPEGGLFTMVTLPEGTDASAILKESMAYKVAFVPCESFFINETRKNTFRLNYSNARPELIHEGIHRLALLLKEAL
jgi:2-aminoadipate transaminase